jgi:hypothetical protein
MPNMNYTPAQYEVLSKEEVTSISMPKVNYTPAQYEGPSKEVVTSIRN